MQSVPPGRWAIGVSGGADSIALLRLLAGQADLALHIVHVNHQARGTESDADEAAVRALGEQLGLPVVVRRLSDLPLAHAPKNPSARYRYARRLAFAEAVAAGGLQGVLLAHHQDDLIETVLQRLLRGGAVQGLVAMRPRSAGALPVLRPLLSVPKQVLCDWLSSIGQPWREDASNSSDAYLRNRLRKLLAEAPELQVALLELHEAAVGLSVWVARRAPCWLAAVPVEVILNCPGVLRDRAVRRWLRRCGVPPERIDRAVVARVLHTAADAASPARQMLPGGGMLTRRRGVLSIVAPASSLGSSPPSHP